MQTIKIRAWLKKEKKMIQVRTLGMGGGSKYVSQVCDPRTTETRKHYKLKDVELLFWSGSLDRNNTPIFEGDIVDSLDDHAIGGEAGYWSYFICEFINTAFRLTGEEGDPVGDWDTSRLEVIGNIYEDEELLK